MAYMYVFDVLHCVGLLAELDDARVDGTVIGYLRYVFSKVRSQFRRLGDSFLADNTLVHSRNEGLTRHG